MSRRKDNTDNKDIEIALTLSGGGYRASVFHIGVLSYLQHLKLEDGSSLLDHVTVMSTISGGTITGVNYLLSKGTQGYENEHLITLLEKIKSNNLADLLLKKVEENKHERTLSIIKELSHVYDDVFFGGQKFERLQNIIQHSHVHHFAVYSTDISNALPFRFQAVRDGYEGVIIGNENREIKRETAAEINIADVVAASSCFPMVFEPINYPRDFKEYEEDEERAQSNMQTQLMDGGILDNQGIDYLLEANRQMVNGGDDDLKGIDLAIISDAAFSLDGSFTSEENIMRQQRSRKWKSVKKDIKKRFEYFTSVNIIQYVLLIFCLLFGILGYWCFQSLEIIFGSLSLTLLILFILVVVGKKCVPMKIKKSYQYKIPKGLVWKISLFQYRRLLEKRYDSFVKVVSTVMMGHIRRGNLQMISENSRWKNRLIIPCISTLSQNGIWKKDSLSCALMDKATQLMEYSDVASRFDTTLWFSKSDIEAGIPEKILVCGQFTICYELYMWIRTHNGNQTNITKILKQLRSKTVEKQLEEDWKQFKQSPGWMLELMKKG